MPRFTTPFEKPAYFEQALFLYVKYSKYLDDDYAYNNQNIFDYFYNLVNRTDFYAVVEDDVLSGFIYLDNFVGNSNRLHSAEVTTCFDEKFWGSYTKICAILFINFCFEKYGLKKLKALVYPENYRVKTLLKSAGFEKEALLKSETLRNNELQDVEIYSCLNTKKKG